MYIRKDDICPFSNRIWLASPTMHGDELRYMMEAYETNWMSTVGANINEVERIAAEKAEVKYAVALSSCTAALHLCVKFAGEKLYGKVKEVVTKVDGAASPSGTTATPNTGYSFVNWTNGTDTDTDSGMAGFQAKSYTSDQTFIAHFSII